MPITLEHASTKLHIVPNTLIVVQDVSELVCSELVYSGDGEDPEDYMYFSHQLVTVLNEKYEDCTTRFKASCRDGIKQPAWFSWDEYNGAYECHNGHHRMAVAWIENLPMPMFFAATINDFYKSSAYHDSRNSILWSDEQ